MHARYSCQGAAALQALADRNTYQLYMYVRDAKEHSHVRRRRRRRTVKKLKSQQG
jgi:hypothetical protein